MAEYRVALVTFIDILGFSDLIDQSRSDKNKEPDRVDKVLRLVRELKKASNFGRAKVDEEGKQVKVFFADNFSDCVVRSTLIDSEPDLLRTIEAELLLMSSMQAYVTAKENMMLRGGMTVGELYRDDKGEFLFGPAFVKAYKLEKEAVVPRVVIDRDIMTVMGARGGSFVTNYTREDDDGVCFVDYLQGAYVDFATWPMTGIGTGDDLMAAHKQAVEKKNVDLRSREIGVRLKAHWMATYHNQVIQRLVKDTPYLQERIGRMSIDIASACL